MSIKKIGSFIFKAARFEMIPTLTASNIYVLFKAPELSFSRSVSKDDGGKVARWLHSHVKSLYSVFTDSTVL